MAWGASAVAAGGREEEAEGTCCSWPPPSWAESPPPSPGWEQGISEAASSLASGALKCMVVV